MLIILGYSVRRLYRSIMLDSLIGFSLVLYNIVAISIHSYVSKRMYRYYLFKGLSKAVDKPLIYYFSFSAAVYTENDYKWSRSSIRYYIRFRIKPFKDKEELFFLYSRFESGLYSSMIGGINKSTQQNTTYRRNVTFFALNSSHGS